MFKRKGEQIMNKREYAEIISKAIANSEVQEMTKTMYYLKNCVN